KYAITDPATGQEEKEFKQATDDEPKSAIETAADRFNSWSKTTPDERDQLLDKVADIYEERTEELAETIGREMGKPVKQARGELGIVVDIYRYYAQNGPDYLRSEHMK